jgi:hypothetical protein
VVVVSVQVGSTCLTPPSHIEHEDKKTNCSTQMKRRSIQRRRTAYAANVYHRFSKNNKQLTWWQPTSTSILCNLFPQRDSSSIFGRHPLSASTCTKQIQHWINQA